MPLQPANTSASAAAMGYVSDEEEEDDEDPEEKRQRQIRYNMMFAASLNSRTYRDMGRGPHGDMPDDAGPSGS